jgi:hypothetical protein
VTQHADFFRIKVKTSKNHPLGFSFRVKFDRERLNCVGVFMADFINVMGIKLGDPKSFLACKLTQSGGILQAAAVEKGGFIHHAHCMQVAHSRGWVGPRHVRDALFKEGRGLGGHEEGAVRHPNLVVGSLEQRLDGVQVGSRVRLRPRRLG